MQDGHPLAYESRKFKSVELQYSTYDKELFAVVYALKIWKHYLMGSEFIIKTDQKSIKHLLSQPLISNRHIKWAAFIQSFQPTFIQSFQPIIQYQLGKENVVADALSRRPYINNIFVIESISFDAMRYTYDHDPDCQDLWLQLHDPNSTHNSSYKHVNGFLYYNGKLCITQPFRQAIMEELHQPPYVGHRGISSIIQTISRDFYWPSMKEDITEFVTECLTYQRVKRYKGKKLGFLQPLPILNAPWEQISMDFITGFPLIASQNNMIWTIIDRFSKQAYFIPCKKTLIAS